MALVKKRGKTKFMYWPLQASSGVYALAGTLMAMSSGYLIIATSTSNGYDMVGVLRHTIATTDDDYAKARMIEIETPVELAVEWEADISGTLVLADVGLYCDITTANGTTTTTAVNRDASTYDIAQISGFISASKARVILNIGTLARLKANS